MSTSKGRELKTTDPGVPLAQQIRVFAPDQDWDPEPGQRWLPELNRQPGQDGYDEPPGSELRQERSLMFKIVVTLVTVIVVLTAGGMATALLLQRHYNQNIQRMGNPFAALPAGSRPQVLAGAGGATNILLLGSDGQISDADNPANWRLGAQQTKAIMIAHISADRSRLTVTSIPNDSWVDVPDHGMHKLNDALTLGGPPLEIRTLEAYTHVRIDHVMVMNFDGFKAVTDNLGGVTINGQQKMNGTAALDYVRAGNDSAATYRDRVRRQQNWVRAILNKQSSQGVAKDVFGLNAVLNSVTKAISADNSFSIGDMRSLAWSMRNISPSRMTFLTVPVSGVSRKGGSGVVNLNSEANHDLWYAVADDKVDTWLAANPDAAHGANVR